MAKILHFYGPLPELILKGKKTITWRIEDDKNITVGDELSLCRNDETEFGKAKVISVKETTFGKLSEKDKEGHEEFNSDDEMYKTYSRYYKTCVDADTKLKVIKFKLIS